MHEKITSLTALLSASPLQALHDPVLQHKGVELWIKRDDLIHPVISGNKWRKLKYILNDALQNAYTEIISMGGAYSNHLHALAFAGKQLGLNTSAYVRGEEPANPSPALVDMQRWGMRLHFISRSDYRQLRADYQQNKVSVAAHQYWLPEGGAQVLALKGVREIAEEIDRHFDYVCLPCGTGTTLAGLTTFDKAKFHVLGFAALKGSDFLERDVNRLFAASNNKPVVDWSICHEFHFGGFAKSNPQLLAFIKQFEHDHNIPLEPVYTGKMFYGLYQLIARGYFKYGQKILALHTGGLQGNRIND